MLPTAILDRFVERCPAVVMIRATLERLLRPERLDQIFEQARQRQYCKQLLFSQVVALMMSVATRTHKSVHAAYQAGKESLGVSPAALYDKINHIEPQTNSIVIRQTAADAAKIIDSMQAAKKEILPGLEVFYLDGNHLAATEHRHHAQPIASDPCELEVAVATVLDRTAADALGKAQVQAPPAARAGRCRG